MATSTNHENIHLCQLLPSHAGEAPAVKYSLTIKADHTWVPFLYGHEVKIYVLYTHCIKSCDYNIKVPCTYLKSVLPTSLHTIVSVLNVLSTLQMAAVCIGNPDAIFKPLMY